jgi:hypothetical protein
MLIGMSSAMARIKLVTLPERAQVVMVLGDSVLVEEERLVSLNQGGNTIDFAWQNVAVDKDSLHIVTQDDDIFKVISTRYPPNENAVTWEVAAKESSSQAIKIRYLLSGIQAYSHYRLTLSSDEKNLSFQQYLFVENQNAESFAPLTLVSDSKTFASAELGGRETKRFLEKSLKNLPVEKRYLADVGNGYLDANEKKINVPMQLVIANRAALGFDGSPLLKGKARIFQLDQQGSPTFIGEDWLPLVLPEEKAFLSLGLAQDVVVKRRILESNNVKVAANVRKYTVEVVYELENFKKEDVVVTIKENINDLYRENFGYPNRQPYWELTADLPPHAEESSAEALTFLVKVPKGGEKVRHSFVITFPYEW